MFHGVIFPTILLFWLFGHGVGSVVGLIVLVWVISMIFHPWRRWGYHPYYDRPWRWGPPPASNASSILEERYAKGDITREEYLQKKQDMGRGGV